MGPSDAELIALSRRDPASFGVLFDRHYDAVRRYAVARLGPDDGEEVAAQTFLVALEQRARYDPSRPDARPWLFGIATNLVRRTYRHHARSFRATSRLRGRVTVPADETELADLRQDVRPVADAVEHLPDADRDVLLLYVWSDLAYGQIAEALDIPVGTVRSRLHRARRTLRAELAMDRGDAT